MVFRKLFCLSWILMGSALMGSSDVQEREKQAADEDWTGCYPCTKVIMALKDKEDIQKRYLECLSPLSVRLLLTDAKTTPAEHSQIKDDAQSCTEILLSEFKSMKGYPVEVEGSPKTSVGSVCKKCQIYRYATNTLDWVRGKMRKDRHDRMKKIVATGAAVGAAGFATGLASAGQSTVTTTYASANYYYPTEGVYTFDPTTSSGLSSLAMNGQTGGLLGSLPMLINSATLIGGMGASALAVYGAYKLGKEAGDRSFCDFSCGLENLRIPATDIFYKNYRRMMGRDVPSEEERKSKNKLLVKIASIHFNNAVESLSEASKHERAPIGSDIRFRIQQKFDGNESLESISKIFVGPNALKDPAAEINYIISLFSKAVDSNLNDAVQLAGRCWFKCPTDLIWQNPCDAISQFKDIETTMRFAQASSYSHSNLLSFDTSRNTNLAKFLMATHGGAHDGFLKSLEKGVSLKYDPRRYGTAETNKCVTRHNRSDAIKERIDALIQFQLLMEKQARMGRGEIKYRAQKVAG